MPKKKEKNKKEKLFNANVKNTFFLNIFFRMKI